MGKFTLGHIQVLKKSALLSNSPERSQDPVKFYFNLVTLDHATNNVLGNLMVSAASKQSSIINLIH